MKNMYLAPITEQMDFISNSLMLDGSEATGLGTPGHPGAPQRLGSVGSIRNVGSLGATGHIK